MLLSSISTGSSGERGNEEVGLRLDFDAEFNRERHRQLSLLLCTKST